MEPPRRPAHLAESDGWFAKRDFGDTLKRWSVARSACSCISNRTKDSNVPQVNPDILRWARETAGLTLEDAVGKLSIKDAQGTAASDRLRALEQGETPRRPARCSPGWPSSTADHC